MGTITTILDSIINRWEPPPKKKLTTSQWMIPSVG